MDTKQTLRKMFTDAGIDPFDAFLLHPADWPAHIREWYNAQAVQAAIPNPPSRPTEWEARTGRDGAE